MSELFVTILKRLKRKFRKKKLRNKILFANQALAHVRRFSYKYSLKCQRIDEVKEHDDVWLVLELYNRTSL